MAHEDLVDTVAAILRAFGEGAFDMDDTQAQMTQSTADAWARHLVLGTAHPETPEDRGSGERRDWQGMRHWFNKHRRSEQQYVSRSFADFRQLVWGFVHDMHRAVNVEGEADARGRHQIEKLRAAVQQSSLEELKREAVQTSELLSSLLEERERRRKEQIQSLGAQLQAMSGRLEEARKTNELDPLTNLFNRRALDAYIERVVELDGMTGTPVCAMMIDLDHFKKLNDTYGHVFGDEVLRRSADLLAGIFLRKCDFVCRYGGEEFTVLLRDTNLRQATMLADRCLQAFRRLSFEGKPELLVTASIGVAELRAEETAKEWLERADKCLYGAKQMGRDRFVTP